MEKEMHVLTQERHLSGRDWHVPTMSFLSEATPVCDGQMPFPRPPTTVIQYSTCKPCRSIISEPTSKLEESDD